MLCGVSQLGEAGAVTEQKVLQGEDIPEVPQGEQEGEVPQQGETEGEVPQ